MSLKCKIENFASWYSAGNVVRVDIAEDNEKKSKGFGTVIFDTPAEALQAVCILSIYQLYFP